MSKFAFVAGATGAAATRLVDELLRQEWRVIGVSRKAPRAQVDAKLTYWVLIPLRDSNLGRKNATLA
jgi:nucleoside-diphosphate-sugar epimerase